MASSEDNSCSRGRFKAHTSFDAISAATRPPRSPKKQPHLRRADGDVEKRRLLDIDLNVAPDPEDNGSDSPSAEEGGDGLQTPPAAAAAASVDEYDLNFSGIQSHWSNRDEIRDEEERRNRRLTALIEVAESASREYGELVPNRKRGASRGDGLGGGELRKPTAWRKIVAAEEVLPPPPVVVMRSTRGRAVAMPNKYRDSVLDAAAVAAAESSRRNKSGKSAAVVSTKRKSR